MGSDLPVVFDDDLQVGGELPRLDATRQVDLLRRVQQGNLPDLLQVHPDRVVRGRLQQVDLDAHLGGGVGLLAGDLDDLDALGGEVVLDLGEELLDLLGGEVVDGDGFQEVLGGDEPALAAASGDGLLHLVQAHQLTSRLGQGCSSGVLCGPCARPRECTETDAAG